MAKSPEVTSPGSANSGQTKAGRDWFKEYTAQIGKNVANPTDKDDIIGGFEQIQLTSSSTTKHIYQLDLRGTANYRSLSAGNAMLDILRS